MKLSIVILTCNSINRIGSCLESLLSTVIIYPVEWIIVDNGSRDGSQQLVKKLLPQAIIIQNVRNLGVSRARNQGIKTSSGQYILLLDDDTRVLPQTIETLCEYLDKHPQCAMVAPQLINTDDSIQANALPIPSVREKFIRIAKKLLRKKHNIYIDKIKTKIPFYPGYLIGACQLIRREVFSVVGLLDEKIFYGPEDADYCLRLTKYDYQIVCLPSVSVIHDYQQRTYRLKNLRLLWFHFTGLIYFWWKHRHSLY
jgi:GT2 family glycosyltransferase